MTSAMQSSAATLSQTGKAQYKQGSQMRKWRMQIAQTQWTHQMQTQKMWNQQRMQQARQQLQRLEVLATAALPAPGQLLLLLLLLLQHWPMARYAKQNLG